MKKSDIGFRHFVDLYGDEMQQLMKKWLVDYNLQLEGDTRNFFFLNPKKEYYNADYDYYDSRDICNCGRQPKHIYAALKLGAHGIWAHDSIDSIMQKLDGTFNSQKLGSEFNSYDDDGWLDTDEIIRWSLIAVIKIKYNLLDIIDDSDLQHFYDLPLSQLPTLLHMQVAMDKVIASRLDGSYIPNQNS